MKISKKCKYGLRAVFEIALSEIDNQKLIKRKTISKNQNIPDSYLENILLVLKNGGIINSLRGAQGGYFLNKPAKDISLYDIVVTLEGRLQEEECLDNVENCKQKDCCQFKHVWDNLRSAQEEILKNVRIADLIENKDFTIPCC